MDRPFGGRARAFSGSEQGFTLIEVLVSALIVTLIAGAVAGGLMANIHAVTDQHHRTAAQALAEQDQERLKGLSATQLDNLSQTYTTTIDNVQYSVTSKAWYLSSTNGTACSSSGGSGATYFKTISTVSSTNAAGVTQTLATDESVITPPAGGGILTQFHDQTTAPLGGVAVAISGPESDAATSDSNGCAIFSALQTGNYNLTFTDNGYVDPNGNASPLAATASVASTGFAAPSSGNPVEMGLGGAVTGQFQTSYGATTYNTQADGLSWLSAGGAGIPMASYRSNAAALSSSIATKTASGTASSNGLFPFVSSLNPVSYANNYQVWPGTCLQEQPPAGIDMFTVTPGSSQTASVLEPALVLTTTWKGSTVAPFEAKATFQSDAGSGTSCTDKWAPLTAVTNVSGPLVYGVPFASSATSGSTASSSGQTGKVTVCADYKSGSTYYQGTATFTDSYTTATAQTIALTTTSTTGKCP